MVAFNLDGYFENKIEPVLWASHQILSAPLPEKCAFNTPI
tara:strand:+ start:263 stop:382 length:120 start_codon:yes stop_codon:yes gene_type:complete